MVVTANGGPAQLFRNDSTPRGGVVRLRLRGTTANRDAIGTRVTGVVNGARVSRMVRTGSSYLSQSELVLSVRPRVRRPRSRRSSSNGRDGQPRSSGASPAGALYEVTEGRGVVGKTPYRR